MMPRFNFRKGADGPESQRSKIGGGSSLNNLSPKAKRLVLIGLVGIILVGGTYLYTNYFMTVPAPTPPPPVVAVPPPPPVPQSEEERPAPVEPSQKPAPLVREAPTSPQVEEKPLPSEVVAKSAAGKGTPGTVKGGQYSVQVAALVFERNAEALKARLEKLGYTPMIRLATAPITKHRVFVGEFNTRAEAEGVSRRLNVDGHASHVTELASGRYGLEVGSFLRLNAAIDLARTLQLKDYNSKIISDPVPTKIHQVRIGRFPREEALQKLAELKDRGYAPLLVKERN